MVFDIKNWEITKLTGSKKIVKFNQEYAIMEDLWYSLPREEGTMITKIDNNSFMIERSEEWAKI